MFSQTVEYALRAVVIMAAQPDTALKTRDISAATQVPADYLFKVLRALSKAGLVQSIRGISGGVKLTRRPEEVTILEIVKAIDPLPRIEKCPINLEAHSKELCPLHRHLDKAIESVETAFAGVTLAELAKGSESSGPFCREAADALPKAARTKKAK